MNVFVSGATGYIGVQLVKKLVLNGLTVHALYRSEEKAAPVRMSGVKLFKGDLLDPASLQLAMKGCTQVYHTAAFASVWSRDPEQVFRLNVNGALNVIEAARATGIQRIVVTSTAGILGPSLSEPVNETSPVPISFFTPYEESKYKMEQELKKITDIEIVIVNPTRVFGPGLLSESNGVTKMIRNYIKNNWRYIPGTGKQSGNYVFVEDVVTGHILAMDKGVAGERYVLGGENLSYLRLWQLVRNASHIQKKLYRIPLWLMLTVSWWMLLLTRLTGNPPLITPDLVRKFNHHWNVSSDKAVKSLGYAPIPAQKGIELTVHWINNPT
jgi:nucleoside-diphosphate-sugar epimerase